MCQFIQYTTNKKVLYEKKNNKRTKFIWELIGKSAVVIGIAGRFYCLFWGIDIISENSKFLKDSS